MVKSSIVKSFLLTLIIILCFSDSNAQIIQLGSGTSINGFYTASPVNIYYRRQVSQFIYTAAEINAAGASGAKDLTQLGFYITSQPIYDIPGYTIKIKHTNATDVSNNLGAGGWTTVKNAFTYAPTAGGYDMIVFDTPFSWNGNRNIAVEICWSQVQPNYSASGRCRIYSTTDGYKYSRDDNTGSICGTTPATLNTNKPQAQLIFDTESDWNGSTSTDWFDAANWDAGIPDSDMDVTIPNTAPRMPSIGSSGAECKNLNINSGASLTISGTNNIDIYEDWTINGTFTANSGTVTLKGDAANNINSGTNQDLYNLTIDNTYGASITTGSINLYGTLDIHIGSGSFNTNNSLTIMSDASGTGRINEITPKCLYVLDMTDSYGDSWDGGFITVLIDGVTQGSYFAVGSNSTSEFSASPGSNVQLNYTAGSYENENSYTLSQGGSVIFSDGTTPATGTNVFNTTSSCTFFNPISNNMTMERYVDAGATEWRFLTSAVSGATLADFNDDFETSGYTGATSPNWPSVASPWPSIYFYDETVTGTQDNGFNAATNATNSIPVGVGVWVWCGDTIIGTQPFTIDITGPPNVGTINLPMTYTNSGLVNDDGWNLLGNPYASTIDWDSPNPNIVKTNINDAVYIWNPDLSQFASYSGGVGTNGGSRYIASSQAIWVQATGSGAGIQLTEACKSTNDGAFLKVAQVFPLRIKARNNFGADELAINFQANATNNFDPKYDAQKISSVNTNIPVVSSITNNEEFSINQLPKQEIDIPIKILTGISGLHTISIENVTNFSNSNCLILEDLFTGISYNLNTDSSFTTFIHDTTTTARFLLHVGAPVDIAVTDANCNGSLDGKIVYTKNSTNTFDITWKDSNGSTISSSTNIFSDSLLNIAAGNYTIETTDAVCGNTTNNITVNSPNLITSYYTTTSDTVYLNNGGNITFNNQSTKATTYLWDFNDGSNTTLSSPTHTYTQAGTYLVNLTASINNNCSENYNRLITVTGTTTSINEINSNKVKSWIDNNAINLYLGDSEYQFIFISNALGENIYASKINSNQIKFDLNNYSSGIYFVNVSDRNGIMKTFKLPYTK